MGGNASPPLGSGAYRGPDDYAIGIPERWSWTEEIPAGTSKVLIDQTRLKQNRDYVLVIKVTGGIATISVRQFYERNEKPYQFHVGAESGQQIRVSGGMQVDVGATGATDSTISIAILDQGAIEPLPPWNLEAALTDQAGAAGVWTDFGNSGGWAPEDRHQCTLYSQDAIDVRFVNAAGAVRAANMSVNGGPQELYHPPHYRLQVRHPGGVSDTRFAVGVWRRADR